MDESDNKEQNKLPKVRQYSGRTWWQVAAGIGLFAVGLLFGSLYTQNMNNMLFALITALSWPCGGFLIWNGLKVKDAGYHFVTGEAKRKGPCNVMKIHNGLDDNGKPIPIKIDFDYTDRPLGQPKKCRNDGKFYYIERLNPTNGVWGQFALPDKMIYFDPREYANAFGLPAHRKLYQNKPSLMQKIAPIFLVVGLIITSIAMIAIVG